MRTPEAAECVARPHALSAPRIPWILCMESYGEWDGIPAPTSFDRQWNIRHRLGNFCRTSVEPPPTSVLPIQNLYRTIQKSKLHYAVATFTFLPNSGGTIMVPAHSCFLPTWRPITSVLRTFNNRLRHTHTLPDMGSHGRDPRSI